MKSVLTAALGGAALLALAVFPAGAATDYSTAKAPLAIGKLEPGAGTSVSRMDKALDGIIAPGAKIERLAHGFVFTEGPMWREGEMWFSDLRGNRVYSVSPTGKLTLRLSKAGGADSFDSRYFRGSNAMVTDKDGNILLCQHSAHRIVKWDGKSQTVTSFIDKYDGKALNSPNDLLFAADGSLYFTDPPYFYADPTNAKIDADKQPGKVQATNNLYHYKDGKLSIVVSDLPRPNGLGITPDGKTFYLDNTEPKSLVYKYDLKADGTVTNKKLVADFSNDKGAGVPDGLKIDSKGNLWVTGEGGIRIISPEGKVLGQIVLPEVSANLAFGGPDMKTLYIMGSTSVYKLQLAIPGERPMYTK